MIWFTEMPGLNGKTRACLWNSDTKPSSHSPDGANRCFLRDPVIVPHYLDGFSLAAISQFLSINGEFAGYDHDTCRAIADYMRDPANVELHVLPPLETETQS